MQLKLLAQSSNIVYFNIQTEPFLEEVVGENYLILVTKPAKVSTLNIKL